MKYQGTAVSMPAATGGFTMCAFDGKYVPIGTKLYSDTGSHKDLLDCLMSMVEALQHGMTIQPGCQLQISAEEAIVKTLGE